MTVDQVLTIVKIVCTVHTSQVMLLQPETVQEAQAKCVSKILICVEKNQDINVSITECLKPYSKER